MPHHRFIVSHLSSSEKYTQLKEEEARHLRTVMRASVGDRVELIDGQGNLAAARIRNIQKDVVDLEITQLASTKASKTPLVLIQAIPRANRLDTILEKSTELGVDAIYLFSAERSERPLLNTHQLQRASAIVKAATKQCGRLFFPTIDLLPPIDQWSALEGMCLFGDVRAQAPLLWQVLKISSQEEPIYFCVGPEAGLSEQEEALLEKKGFQGVRLHPYILRTDTAPLAALSLLMHAKELRKQ